jgi:hypothetical protein
VTWPRDRVLSADHALDTLLPDLSELPRVGLEGWRAGFVDRVARACRSVADRSVAIF